MSLDSKTLSIILAIVIQSVSLVWFISKMDSRIENNTRDLSQLLNMHHKYDEMERQLDKLMWLLEQDSLAK